MLESFENFQSSTEKKERLEASELLKRLANAFGGHSQVPDYVVGMAFAGQINNGELCGLSVEDCIIELEHIVGEIHDRWLDQNPNSDKIHGEIIRGMKEEAKEWDEESNRVWALLRAIEKK